MSNEKAAIDRERMMLAALAFELADTVNELGHTIEDPEIRAKWTDSSRRIARISSELKPTVTSPAPGQITGLC